MCLFRSAAPAPMPTPAPIVAKKPQLIQEKTLPTKKELLDPEEVTGVEYGTSAKAQQKTQKTGTDALKINLNTGTGGASAGGINV